MLGGKSFLDAKDAQKSCFSGEIQASKLHEILDQKDKEIARLTKAVKKLKKELKQKEEGLKVPAQTEGNNGYFKIMLQKEVSRYNELRELLIAVTQRIRKISQEINSDFYIFQSNASMEDLARMLETANISSSKGGKSVSLENSSQCDDQSIYAEQTVDEFQIVARGLMMKHGQINKMYKQSQDVQKQLQQDMKSIQKEIKIEKKSKDLLQKLLQKSETEKNQLINHINNIASKQEIQDLRVKSKQEVIASYFKLHYRIQDLEKEKEEYLKSSTQDKQKQVKLYQVLLNQVKDMKQKQRSRLSIA